MKATYVKIGFLLAAFVAMGGLMSAPWSSDREPAVARAVSTLDGQWVGRPAPAFDLPDLSGETHTLADYRGKVIFLNFWASFCEPCRREMPSMERLIRDYKGRGLEMLAISMDAERGDAQQFLNRFMKGRRSAMTVLWDPDGDVSTSYGTELIPETYIIDRRGKVVARFVNEYDWTRPEVKKLVEALLNS